MKTICTAALAMMLISASVVTANASDVSCEVLTIEASSSAQGTDPALSALSSIFQKPPFSDFDTFRLVDRKNYALSLTAPVALSLPGNLKGTLAYGGQESGRLNLTLRLSRDDSVPAVITGRTTPGVPFIAAGLRSEKGRWIFAVICNRSATPVHHP
jgi:hypothetical protein